MKSESQLHISIKTGLIFFFGGGGGGGGYGTLLIAVLHRTLSTG